MTVRRFKCRLCKKLTFRNEEFDKYLHKIIRCQHCNHHADLQPVKEEDQPTTQQENTNGTSKSQEDEGTKETTVPKPRKFKRGSKDDSES